MRLIEARAQDGPPEHSLMQRAKQAPDARASRLRALSAGQLVSPEPAVTFNFAIDALMGIGGTLSVDRPGTQLMFRGPAALDVTPQVLVCGCGSPSRIHAWALGRPLGEHEPCQRNS